MRRVAKWYVYRNLTKGGYSVRRFGKVLYVAKSLWLMGVDFQVSQAGNARVRESGQKNVHAYCTTTFCPGIMPASDLVPYINETPARVTYNPHTQKQFMWANDFDCGTIYKATIVALNSEGCFAYGVTGTGSIP